MRQQINLLNPALITVKEWLNASFMALLVGVTIVVMLLVYSWNNYRISHFLEKQQSITQALVVLKQELEIAKLQHKPRAPTRTLQEKVNMAETSLKEHQQVQRFLQGGNYGNKQGFSGYMAAFARQSINGLWLTSFSVNNAVSNIKISGQALLGYLVPQYIRGLAQEPTLIGLDFSELEMSTLVPKSENKKSVKVKAEGTIIFILNAKKKQLVVTAGDLVAKGNLD